MIFKNKIFFLNIWKVELKVVLWKIDIEQKCKLRMILFSVATIQYYNN